MKIFQTDFGKYTKGKDGNSAVGVRMGILMKNNNVSFYLMKGRANNYSVTENSNYNKQGKGNNKSTIVNRENGLINAHGDNHGGDGSKAIGIVVREYGGRTNFEDRHFKAARNNFDGLGTREEVRFSRRFKIKGFVKEDSKFCTGNNIRGSSLGGDTVLGNRLRRSHWNGRQCLWSRRSAYSTNGVNNRISNNRSNTSSGHWKTVSPVCSLLCWYIRNKLSLK